MDNYVGRMLSEVFDTVAWVTHKGESQPFFFFLKKINHLAGFFFVWPRCHMFIPVNLQTDGQCSLVSRLQLLFNASAIFMT